MQTIKASAIKDFIDATDFLIQRLLQEHPSAIDAGGQYTQLGVGIATAAHQAVKKCEMGALIILQNDSGEIIGVTGYSCEDAVALGAAPDMDRPENQQVAYLQFIEIAFPSDDPQRLLALKALLTEAFEDMARAEKALARVFYHQQPVVSALADIDGIEAKHGDLITAEIKEVKFFLEGIETHLSPSRPNAWESFGKIIATTDPGLN